MSDHDLQEKFMQGYQIHGGRCQYGPKKTGQNNFRRSFGLGVHFVGCDFSSWNAPCLPGGLPLTLHDTVHNLPRHIFCSPRGRASSTTLSLYFLKPTPVLTRLPLQPGWDLLQSILDSAASTAVPIQLQVSGHQRVTERVGE